jgi:hypothetical protein
VRVWGVPIEDVELALYGLNVEERTGKKFAMAE